MTPWTLIKIFLKSCIDAYKDFEQMETAFKMMSCFIYQDPYTVFETMTEYNGFLTEC